MGAEGPLVLDADALNLLAAEPRQRTDWILTPHPGEAGRLLGQTTAAVQRDRRAALAASNSVCLSSAQYPGGGAKPPSTSSAIRAKPRQRASRR